MFFITIYVNYVYEVFTFFVFYLLFVLLNIYCIRRNYNIYILIYKEKI